jgi:hypothetical protein
MLTVLGPMRDMVKRRNLTQVKSTSDTGGNRPSGHGGGYHE